MPSVALRPSVSGFPRQPSFSQAAFLSPTEADLYRALLAVLHLLVAFPENHCMYVVVRSVLLTPRRFNRN